MRIEEVLNIALLIDISNPTHPIPLIAFEHLSLYIQKYLSQSVAVVR